MTEKRYPATAYDRDLDDWSVTTREISQVKVAEELAHGLAHGLPLRGGPLPPQRANGSVGPEDGSAISITWSSFEHEDGTRRVLGWYVTGR